MTKNNDDLSIEQLNAIDLLIAGLTDEEVAGKVNVVRLTVWNWRNNNESFKEALAKKREEIFSSHLHRLNGLIPHAISAIEDVLLNSSNEQLKAKTAIDLLKLAQFDNVKQKLDPQQTVTSTSVAAALYALHQQNSIEEETHEKKISVGFSIDEILEAHAAGVDADVYRQRKLQGEIDPGSV